MSEWISVKDRCTKAHEYIFLLTKNSRYWYDHEAIKEPQQEISIRRAYSTNNVDECKDANIEELGYSISGKAQDETYKRMREKIDNGWEPTRNKRSVWTVTTKPYSGAHYAVFPPDLIEPCILAGCPDKVCVKCGAPWERVVESETVWRERPNQYTKYRDINGQPDQRKQGLSTKTLGWQPTCECDAETRPGVVLDPFIGSGTTAMVARKHGREAIGLDLNFQYLNTNARERLVYGSFIPIADGVNQLTIGV